MDPASRRSIDRLLKQMSRDGRKSRRRIVSSPFVLALGLIMADLLLTIVVPRLWATILPGGLEQARGMSGWPGLVRDASVFCGQRQKLVQVGIGATALVAFMLSYRFGPMRPLVWLAAVTVVVMNAGILLIAMRASMSAVLGGFAPGFE